MLYTCYTHVIHTGLRSGLHHFLFFVLTLTLVSFTSVAQSFMFSSFFETFNVAYALYLMVLTVNMVSYEVLWLYLSVIYSCLLDILSHLTVFKNGSLGYNILIFFDMDLM